MSCATLLYNLTGKRALYNIMPISNIPCIMENGILSYNNILCNHVSVADPQVQQKRNKRIPSGQWLHNYANLYFDPRNPMMYKRRNEYETLCVLAINSTVLDIDGVVISDRNAASRFASFGTLTEMQAILDFDTIYMRDWNDNNEYVKTTKRAIKCAEILVPGKIPPEYIIGAYVANSSAESALLRYGFEKRIKLSPDIFFR